MPKVSVIIPVYNVEKYLYDCLDSVLSQTFVDFEAICVNDGSPDGCDKILNNYAAKDGRIKIVTQKNQGLSVARNNGFKIAKGEYIVFLDSDDVMHPQFLEFMYGEIEQTKADVICCNTQKISENEKNIKFEIYQGFTSKKVENVFDSLILKNNKNLTWSVFNKIYKREVVEKFPFVEGIKIAEDAIFCFEVFYEYHKIFHLDLPLSYYRIRQGSLMTSHITEATLDSQIFVTSLIIEKFGNRKMSAKTLQFFNHRFNREFYRLCIKIPFRDFFPHETQKLWTKYSNKLNELQKEKNFSLKFLGVGRGFLSWLFLHQKFFILNVCMNFICSKSKKGSLL